jgi:hypothetical protein
MGYLRLSTYLRGHEIVGNVIGAENAQAKKLGLMAGRVRRRNHPGGEQPDAQPIDQAHSTAIHNRLHGR